LVVAIIWNIRMRLQWPAVVCGRLLNLWLVRLLPVAGQ
jgi:hypothetical protein